MTCGPLSLAVVSSEEIGWPVKYLVEVGTVGAERWISELDSDVAADGVKKALI